MHLGCDDAVLLVHGKFHGFVTLATLQLLPAMQCVRKLAAAVIKIMQYYL